MKGSLEMLFLLLVLFLSCLVIFSPFSFCLQRFMLLFVLKYSLQVANINDRLKMAY